MIKNNVLGLLHTIFFLVGLSAIAYGADANGKSLEDAWAEMTEKLVYDQQFFRNEQITIINRSIHSIKVHVEGLNLCKPLREEDGKTIFDTVKVSNDIVVAPDTETTFNYKTRSDCGIEKKPYEANLKSNPREMHTKVLEFCDHELNLVAPRLVWSKIGTIDENASNNLDLSDAYKKADHIYVDFVNDAQVTTRKHGSNSERLKCSRTHLKRIIAARKYLKQSPVLIADLEKYYQEYYRKKK